MDYSVLFVLVFVQLSFPTGSQVREVVAGGDIAEDLLSECELWTILSLDLADKLLNQGFENISSALFQIDEEVQRIVVDAEDHPARLDFKKNILFVQEITTKYESYSKNLDEIIFFEQACENYLMGGVARLIYIDITHESLAVSLMKDIREMDSLRDILTWSRLVVLTFIKTSIMDDACRGTLYKHDQKSNDIRDFYRNEARQRLIEIISALRNMIRQTEIVTSNKNEWEKDGSCGNGTEENGSSGNRTEMDVSNGNHTEEDGFTRNGTQEYESSGNEKQKEESSTNWTHVNENTGNWTHEEKSSGNGTHGDNISGNGIEEDESSGNDDMEDDESNGNDNLEDDESNENETGSVIGVQLSQTSMRCPSFAVAARISSFGIVFTLFWMLSWNILIIV